MFFLVIGIDQNIINENNHEFIQLRHEHRTHEIHEVGRGIGKAEGHD
jgi:hypothetical protein